MASNAYESVCMEGQRAAAPGLLADHKCECATAATQAVRHLACFMSGSDLCLLFGTGLDSHPLEQPQQPQPSTG
jgi:hypothetical protein